MRFDQATQQPVSITLVSADPKNPKKKIETNMLIPKFDLQDWVNWGAELDAARKDEATADLDPVDKFKLLGLYPILPIDFTDMKGYTESPAGVQKIITVCLKKMDKDDAWVKSFIAGVSFDDRRELARQLADIQDPTTLTNEGSENQTLEGEGSPDPLARTKKDSAA